LSHFVRLGDLSPQERGEVKSTAFSIRDSLEQGRHTNKHLAPLLRGEVAGVFASG
jgi:hypothetical protein